MAALGEVPLTNYYNDGNKGTGTSSEMALEQRQLLAVEGVVIAAIDVLRDPRLIAAAAARAAGGRNAGGAEPSKQSPMHKEDEQTDNTDQSSPETVTKHQLSAKIRVTTRAMWTDKGRLERELYDVIDSSIKRLAADATLPAIERNATDAIRRACKLFNNRRPEVVVVAHEADPRYAAAVESIAARRRKSPSGRQPPASSSYSSPSEGDASPVDRLAQRGRKTTAGKTAGGKDRFRKQRSLQQREKDLLFAGRGGDVEELGTAAPSESSEEEDTMVVDPSDVEASEDVDAEVPTNKMRGSARNADRAANVRNDGSGKRKSSTEKSYQRSRVMAGRIGARDSMARTSRGSPRMPPMQRLDPEKLKRRQQQNPRDAPSGDGDVEYP